MEIEICSQIKEKYYVKITQCDFELWNQSNNTNDKNV